MALGFEFGLVWFGLVLRLVLRLVLGLGFDPNRVLSIVKQLCGLLFWLFQRSGKDVSLRQSAVVRGQVCRRWNEPWSRSGITLKRHSRLGCLRVCRYSGCDTVCSCVSGKVGRVGVTMIEISACNGVSCFFWCLLLWICLEIWLSRRFLKNSSAARYLS